MKIHIQKQSDKKSPYRLKFQGFTVSLSTRAEVERVKQFIQKIINHTVISSD